MLADTEYCLMENIHTYQYVNLVNYRDDTVDDVNYIPSHTSASPDSFPEIMENGILVRYEYPTEISETVQEPDLTVVDLAVEQNKLEDVNSDMQYIKAVCGNPDFKSLIKSPIIQPSKKAGVFKALFGSKVGDLTNKFL